VIVRNLTEDYYLAGHLLKKFYDYLVPLQAPITQEMQDRTVFSACRALYLTGQLMEHLDFDEHYEKLTAVETNAVMLPMNKGKVFDDVFQLIIKFASPSNTSESVRRAALAALGSVFTARPKSILCEESLHLIDGILRGCEASFELKLQLLGILSQFLYTDEKRMQRRSAKDQATKEEFVDAPKVDLKTLQGRSEEISETGISSSLMQHFIDPVLELMLHENIQARTVAFDMVYLVLKQGLLHPLQCIPYLIAIESVKSSHLCERAASLHMEIYNKHPSFANVRNMDGVRLAYDHLQAMTGKNCSPTKKVSKSDRTTALSRLYEIVKGKRAHRKDFITKLVCAFESPVETEKVRSSGIWNQSVLL
jgi:hypothetical protein